MLPALNVVSDSSGRNKFDLLLEQKGLNGKITIIRTEDGRVQGFLKKEKGRCHPMAVKGLPCYVAKENVAKVVGMLRGSYLNFGVDFVEVKPRGCGGVKDLTQSCFSWEDVDPSFLCPITHEVMKDPVLTNCGHTFERIALLENKQCGRETCPVCGEKLEHYHDNTKLKSEIANWRQKQTTPSVTPRIFPLDPKSGEVEVNYETACKWIKSSSFYAQNEKYAKAIEQYEKGLKYTDKIEDYEGYVALLEKAGSPKLIKAYAYLALSYRHEMTKLPASEQELQKKKEEYRQKAENAYQNAIALEPKNIIFREELIRHLSDDIEGTAKLTKAHEDLIRVAPRDTSQAIDLIITHYRALIALNPAPEKYYQAYLTFLIEVKRTEEAIILQEEIQKLYAVQQEEEQRAIDREEKEQKARLLAITPWSKKSTQSTQQWTDYNEVLPKQAISLDLRERNYQEVSQILKRLEQFTKLKSLNLSGCKELTNADVEGIAKVKTLRSLNLSGCSHITMFMVAKLLENHGKIEKLRLRNNPQLTVEGIDRLFQYGKNLRYVDFGRSHELSDGEVYKLVSERALNEVRKTPLTLVLPCEKKVTFQPDEGEILPHLVSLAPVKKDYAAGAVSCKVLEGHTDIVYACAVLQNGLIASGSRDRTIKIWHPDLSKCILSLEGHKGLVRGLIALRDGRLASAAFDKTVKVWAPWNSSEEQCVLTLNGHTDDVICVTALEGNLLASGGRTGDNEVRIWDLSSGKYVRSLKGHKDAIWAMATLPNGRLATATGLGDATVRIWDVETSQCLQEFSHRAGSLSVLNDGCLASGGFDSKIKIWDVATGNCQSALTGCTEPIGALVTLPNGRLASGSRDHKVRIWDAKEGKCLCTLEGHTNSIQALTVLPDGRLVSASNDHTVRIWDFPEASIKKEE